MPVQPGVTSLRPGGRRSGALSAADAAELGTIACVFVAAALTSTSEDWQPPGLVLALAALMVVADMLPVAARRIRLSAGLLVQVVAMAVLGPGGIGFGVMRAVLDLDPHDTAYALLVMPMYVAIAGLNLALVTVRHPGSRKRIVQDIGMSTLPIELLSGVMAGATVLVWAHGGLAAAAALLLLLVITVPLVRTLGDALKRGDDLVALQHVSDERAAEVARLSTDRERLLTEMLDAEQRERTRLAESLHDAIPAAIRVVLEGDDDWIVLVVDDDGVGIDEVASRRAVKAGHVGLAMVRRRVEDLGGTLEIATRADGGTHSRVILPSQRG